MREMQSRRRLNHGETNMTQTFEEQAEMKFTEYYPYEVAYDCPYCGHTQGWSDCVYEEDYKEIPQCDKCKKYFKIKKKDEVLTKQMVKEVLCRSNIDNDTVNEILEELGLDEEE